jgi:hypothetical protein
MTDTEVVAEGELREWATAHNITAKTVDLLVKDGFSSMDALELFDKEDLLHSKILRGQQKLLLMQASDGGRADDRSDGGSHRGDNSGGGHVRGWRNSPGAGPGSGRGTTQRD